MKVNGSISPDVFILEDDPSNPMLQRAIFRENVTKKDNGEYDYDEYVLPIKKTDTVLKNINDNYAFYLLAAKGRDSWEQMNSMINDKTE